MRSANFPALLQKFFTERLIRSDRPVLTHQFIPGRLSTPATICAKAFAQDAIAPHTREIDTPLITAFLNDLELAVGSRTQP